MKHLAIFLLAAGLAWGQLPVELMRKTVVPPRRGLMAEYDLRNTGDVGSVANKVLGGAALQRGSTPGSDTNDPTVGTTGWEFNGTDDYAVITTPALGLATAPPATIMIVSLPLTNKSVNPLFEIDSNQVELFGEFLSGANFYSRFNGYSISALTPAAYGSWYVTASVYDPAYVNTYLNGVFKARTALTGTVSLSISNSINIGVRGGDRFNGRMSYILIYDRALSAKEIQQTYNWLKAKMAEVGVLLGAVNPFSSDFSSDFGVTS